MNKFYFILSYCLFISCKSEKVTINTQNDTYISNCFNRYSMIYLELNDTLINWKKDSLQNMLYLMDSNSVKLDSFIVFNSDTTRLFGYVIKKDIGHKDAIFDYLNAIGGAKIKGKWYFFFGMQPVIDRASYQDSIYAPLSFDELSYLAREHLQKALTIHENGSITANDSFFDFMYNRNDWGLPKNSSLEELDSLIVARNVKKHQHKIDPKELEDIKKDMARSVRPPEPKQDISLWQKLFGKEEKLFESKEWKEYLRNKYGKDVN